MPISISLGLIIVISLAAYFYLRPLRILSTAEWLISHGIIMVALLFVLGWLWMNRAQFVQIPLLMAGIWGITGGICFVVVFVIRRLRNKGDTLLNSLING